VTAPHEQATAPPTFTITVRQLAELTDLAGILHTEAEHCRDAGRWISSLIALGGSAEAAMLATACVFEPELRAADLWHPPKDDPTRWTLGELSNIARAAGWLATRLPAASATTPGVPAAKGVTEEIFDSLNGEIGDALKFVQRLRNMIVHPGAYVREPLRPHTGNDEHMRQTYELMDGILSHLFDRLTTQMNTLTPTP
jgi:hypothetical protein